MNIYGHKTLSYLLWRYVLRQPRLRRVLQRLVYPNKETAVTLLGADLTIHTQKELGYWRAAQNQLSNIVFRDEVAHIMSVASLVDNDVTFVDCGANVGLWTCNIARLNALYPQLRVLAFEANPDTFARLEKSVSSFCNVRAICMALSDVPGEIRMFEAAGSNAFGAHPKHWHIPTESRVIPALPLDTFLGGIDNIVMKVDVEGHELSVLKGAEAAQRRHAFKAVFIDGFAAGDEAEILQWFVRAGLRSVLNGRTLRPFQTGDATVLAIRT